LEDLDDGVKIESKWEMIRENAKILVKESLGYELKKHKPWFDEKCSKLLYQRKELNCCGYRMEQCKKEASKQFRSKKMKYL
jgi:hypothetical protein